MSNTTHSGFEPDFEQRVSERAYRIWVEEGKPEGCSSEHWSRAEQEILSTLQAERKRNSQKSNVVAITSKATSATEPSILSGRAAEDVAAKRTTKAKTTAQTKLQTKTQTKTLSTPTRTAKTTTTVAKSGVIASKTTKKLKAKNS